MRWLKRRRIKGKEERGAHQSRRNRATKLAEGWISDEEFVPSGGVSGEREKGARGRGSLAIYSRPSLAEGARVVRGGRGSTARGSRARPGDPARA
jgi:hypothetical protein